MNKCVWGVLNGESDGETLTVHGYVRFFQWAVSVCLIRTFTLYPNGSQPSAASYNSLPKILREAIVCVARISVPRYLRLLT